MGGEQNKARLPGTTRRDFMALGMAGAVASWSRLAEGQQPNGIATSRTSHEPRGAESRSASGRRPLDQPQAAARNCWSFVQAVPGTIDEVATFTGFTHPPVPLGELQRRAGVWPRSCRSSSRLA